MPAELPHSRNLLPKGALQCPYLPPNHRLHCWTPAPNSKRYLHASQKRWDISLPAELDHFLDSAPLLSSCPQLRWTLDFQCTDAVLTSQKSRWVTCLLAELPHSLDSVLKDPIHRFCTQPLSYPTTIPSHCCAPGPNCVRFLLPRSRPHHSEELLQAMIVWWTSVSQASQKNR